MNRVGRITSILCTIGLFLPTLPATAATPCTLCIAEVQTQGGLAGTEDQDAVVIVNRSATNITSVQLRYMTAVGLPSEVSSLAVGTIAAGSTKVLVAPSLVPLNPGADSLKTLQLSSTGGALILGRSTSSTIYDTVGWGAAVAGFEGAAAPSHDIGHSLVRKSVAGTLQDTDLNSVDFELQDQGCTPAEFSEIQPFVADVSGAPIEAWVELMGTDEPNGDCVLVSSMGEQYVLPAAELPGAGATTVFNRGIDDLGSVVPLHLGETAAQLWLTGRGGYGGEIAIKTPRATVQYSSLQRGQTVATIDGLWRRTFAPTPGEANLYAAEPTVAPVTSTECEGVVINELLPNPTGEDGGKEWIELRNTTNEHVLLGACLIGINGSQYGFLEDDVLDPMEYRAIEVVYDSDGTAQSLSLRNSEDNTLTWMRSESADVVILQQLSYADATEGVSWARYDDGWRWDASPTPNQDNATEPEQSGVTPERPAADGGTSTDDNEVPVPSDSASVSIVELLPNPAAPQTDDADEYIELHNAGGEAVALRGYKLQTGNTYSYSYTFTDQVIEPNDYLAISSAVSGLTLSNTSGRARLVSPSGTVISETEPYGSAPQGEAWSYIDGTWKWTSALTPGVQNAFMPSLVKVQPPKVTTAKAKTTKVAAPAKKTTAKTTTPKATKAAKTTVANGSAGSATGDNPEPALHTAILAGVGVVAVLYAAYEYRTDISNRVYQFRRNRAARRAHRS